MGYDRVDFAIIAEVAEWMKALDCTAGKRRKDIFYGNELFVFLLPNLASMAKDNIKSIGFEGDTSDLGKFRRGNNYVLGIGIDEYELHPLNNCVRDVEVFTGVLVERYNFKKEHIKLLLNREATRQAVISTLREYAETITADDNFILYYSGHGILDKKYNEGYWLVSGCDAKNYASDGLANQDVLRNIQALKARHVVLLIDSCFSGSFFYTTRDISDSFSDVDELEKNPSRWAITAGRNEPVSDGQTGDHSPFAKYLLDYLRRDNHPDGRFTVADLDQQIKRSVGPNSAQKPDGRPLQNAGHQGGAFVFRLKTETKEQIAFKKAVEKRDIRLLEDFIVDYENSPLKADAIKMHKELEVERDWTFALRKDTIISYVEFREKHPKSTHAKEALSSINKLRAERDREETLFEKPDETKQRSEADRQQKEAAVQNNERDVVEHLPLEADEVIRHKYESTWVEDVVEDPRGKLSESTKKELFSMIADDEIERAIAIISDIFSHDESITPHPCHVILLQLKYRLTTIRRKSLKGEINWMTERSERSEIRRALLELIIRNPSLFPKEEKTETNQTNISLKNKKDLLDMLFENEDLQGVIYILKEERFTQDDREYLRCLELQGHLTFLRGAEFRGAVDSVTAKSEKVQVVNALFELVNNLT